MRLGLTGPNFHDWLVTGQGLELRTSVETLFFLLQAHIFLSRTFWKLWLGAVRVAWGQQCGQAVQVGWDLGRGRRESFGRVWGRGKRGGSAIQKPPSPVLLLAQRGHICNH